MVTPLWLLGTFMGVVLAGLLVWAFTFLPPARARPLAGLGYALSVVWLLVWVPASLSPSFEIGGLVQATLLGAILAGVLLGIPRWLRWRERPWLSLGVGLLIPNVLALGAAALNYGLHYGLALDENAAASRAFTRSLPWALPAAGVGVSLLAWQARRRGAS
ncbi:hypothetical protein [Deinococcus budaensis]|uniref:Uncharacterized protein n=1 Tax=Deinococcus budaensis TaxID=1665626 RepID=A0A7W8GF97_9DEIO|nr:hypothetical protein [Deinococcus budaensis]MBB5234564.1 hypothetical protein [Deinococcus budaensis]